MPCFGRSKLPRLTIRENVADAALGLDQAGVIRFSLQLLAQAVHMNPQRIAILDADTSPPHPFDQSVGINHVPPMFEQYLEQCVLRGGQMTLVPLYDDPLLGITHLERTTNL